MENDIVKRLNDTVSTVMTADSLVGFEKAYLIAKAAGELKAYLTPEYMKPIMDLQGNKLGFKTDKDFEGGYREDIVKNCLIEAVLTGVQPFGNQFNIIAGNCYITKEGFGYLLANFPGLEYEIIPALPRINGERSSAAIVMKIVWTLNGKVKEREIDFPIRMNKAMGTDAVIGKATRKARAWLYNTITGKEIGDGDVMDIDVKVVQNKEVVTKEELSTLLDEKIALLTKTEFDDAKRIIANEEIESYSKLATLLKGKSE
jgi:hypothetical protein